MNKHINFKDIGQFRNTIKTIQLDAAFVRIDEQTQEPIYDFSIKKPTITFKGTVKLHGTNAGVSCYNGNIWYQARNRTITLENDNAGFALFAKTKQEIFTKLFTEIKQVITDQNIITIFGEWCGQGIQKGVGISELEKMFVIFAIKITPIDEEKSAYYLNQNMLTRFPNNQIYSIDDYKTYSINIDFENPEVAQNKLIKYVNEVEEECPVAKSHGIEKGMGEGIVWIGYFKDKRYTFKTKGEKHSISKVKTLVPIDEEMLKTINDFVEYAVTENRLQQGIEYVFTQQNREPDIKHTKDFLAWCMRDIIKEEEDVLIKNQLETKQVTKYLVTKIKVWFFNYLTNTSY